MLVRLVIFILAGFVTPGPNTMIALASGVNFGLRRTVPHISGVMVGTTLVFLAVGFGLAGLLQTYPSLRIVIETVGLAYLIYLCWRIANAAGAFGKEAGKPFTFVQSLFLQAVNVKLMGVAAGVYLTYRVSEEAAFNLIAIAMVAMLINLPVNIAWCVFGTRMRAFLECPKRRRLFNLALALVMAASLTPAAWALWQKLAGHGS
ncbi:MAG: LysE family translocator [Pseudomonadota bacterium]